MDRIKLPIWINHGECLLTALCALGIGAVTLLFPQTPWGQKNPLQTSTSQTVSPNLWHIQEVQWPLFAWQPITPDQLQQRVLNWLFTPQGHWQSQHSSPTNNTQQDTPHSYSVTLHLPADELDILWQVPPLTPAWPGWAFTEASGIYSGDHWKIQLHWRTTHHQKTVITDAHSDFWHGTHTLTHTHFAHPYWQPIAIKPTANKATNPRSIEALATSTSSPVPPAHLVGLLQSARVSGAWLQVATAPPFFLSESQPWQGFVLEISPQNIVYLSKPTQRWQLNRCQQQTPCLVRAL